MENASKALIIAGAILISIVLIGVGVLIVGNAQGIFNQGSVQMSQLEIQAFNEPFMGFEGRQSGSNIRSLLQKVATHNATYSSDTDKQVKVTCAKANLSETVLEMNGLSAARQAIGVGSTYTVSIVYHADNSGLIQTLVIQ